jgi:hypothetical protein
MELLKEENYSTNLCQSKPLDVKPGHLVGKQYNIIAYLKGLYMKIGVFG